MVIGLTGPSGAGKSAVAKLFASYGVPAVNADRVYHELLCRNGALSAELTARFGAGILDGTGRVDRAALGAAVFGHTDTPERLAALNAITHKYIMASIRRRVRRLLKNGASAVLLDAPQLFEAGAERDCDAVIGVIASPDVRLARIMHRDGIDEQTARRRMAAQFDEAYFRRRCDYVIENNSTPAELARRVCRLIKKLGLICD